MIDPKFTTRLLIPRTVRALWVTGETRASKIRHYDESLRSVFRYAIVGSPKLIGEFTEELGKGFYSEGYGPFWPSFASVNDGSDGKALWLSQAGLDCLRTNLKGRFLFEVAHKEESY